jgi:hypothetical protein
MFSMQYVEGELTERLEVRDGTASSVLASCLLGGVERFERAELGILAVDSEQAGETVTGLIVRVCGLGRACGTLELCVSC